MGRGTSKCFTIQSCEAVLGWARISGSKTFALLNSRLESKRESEGGRRHLRAFRDIHASHLLRLLSHPTPYTLHPTPYTLHQGEQRAPTRGRVPKELASRGRQAPPGQPSSNSQDLRAFRNIHASRLLRLRPSPLLLAKPPLPVYAWMSTFIQSL